MASWDMFEVLPGSREEVKHWETDLPLTSPDIELFPLKLLLPCLMAILLLRSEEGKL